MLQAAAARFPRHRPGMKCPQVSRSDPGRPRRLVEFMSSEPVARPLPILRAMIDSPDHELLQIAARRMSVVAEIAEYKRHHHPHPRCSASARS